MTSELIIIGRGLAALVALNKALAQGLQTTVVYDNAGATQHFSGAFDVIDPRLNDHQIKPQNYPSVTTALKDFIKSNPKHLYTKLSQTRENWADHLAQEIKSFISAYQIPASIDPAQMLITWGPNGKIKPCAAALKTHALRVADYQNYKKAVLLDFEGLSNYASSLISKNLSADFSSVRVLKINDFKPEPNAALARLLLHYDQQTNLIQLANTLASQIQPDELVIMPPVLGLENVLKNHAHLEAILKTRVIELLSLTPSSAGQRLQIHLEHFFKTPEFLKKPVHFIKGKVTAFGSSEHQITSITLQTPTGKTQTLKASNFILATGKYLGGGLQKKPHFFESIFDLPVLNGNQVLRQGCDISDLISRDPHASQGFMTIGLATNAQGTPIAPLTSKPCFTNLKACGHILKDFDFSREHCGFGVSLASSLSLFQ